MNRLIIGLINHLVNKFKLGNAIIRSGDVLVYGRYRHWQFLAAREH